MIVEILIAAGIGALVGTALAFFDEIINWGKSLFNKLSKSVKQAWVYVQRIPGGIKRFFRYLDGWDIKETEGSTRTIEWSEVERMYRDHEIDYDTYQNLKSGKIFRLSKYMREVEWSEVERLVDSREIDDDTYQQLISAKSIRLSK